MSLRFGQMQMHNKCTQSVSAEIGRYKEHGATSTWRWISEACRGVE